MQDSDPAADSTPAPLSRAADIPQELFEHIAWHAIRRITSVPSNDTSVCGKCTLSLVSTYLAAICRPRIFHDLQFRDAKQMRGFLNLMEASATPSLPHISTFVRRIDIKPAGSDGYWIHQIATALLPKLKRYRNQTPRLTLWLKGHGSLASPRTMMPLLARFGVQGLHLQDMTFRRGEELLRILSMFPALDICTFTSVALEAVPDPATIQRNLPDTSLRAICFPKCTPAFRTWLIHCLMSGAGRNIRLPWDQEDVEAILELSRHFELWAVMETFAPYQDIELRPHNINVIILLYSKTFGHLVDDIALHVRRVHRAVFTVCSSNEESQARIAEASSKLGRTLGHLQEIKFTFHVSSELESFVTAFHTILQQAVGSARLVYCRCYCVSIDPQFILSKRYYARFLGTESGWCRSTGRGGGPLVCIPAMTA